MCKITRVSVVGIWSLAQCQTMPLFTGVITFPKFVELHPYCLEHKCCLDRGKIGNEFDEIDGWVCPRRPDRADPTTRPRLVNWVSRCHKSPAQRAVLPHQYRRGIAACFGENQVRLADVNLAKGHYRGEKLREFSNSC